MAIETPSQLRELCQAGKEADPGWYFVHRRLSIYVTWVLLHTSITPNQVTGLMMLAGVAGAALLVPHSPAANIAAFFVLYLAFLLDKRGRAAAERFGATHNCDFRFDPLEGVGIFTKRSAT